MGDCSFPESIDPKEFMFVVDGGALLHYVPWTKGALFSEILNAYVRYISTKYPTALVVFDGYTSGPTTKDTTHVRRSHGVTSVKVYFSKSTPLVTRKEKFLANSENKQNLICLLSDELETAGYNVSHAEGDADVLIVKSALEIATTKDVVIIGEDTDILVLLLYHLKSVHKQVIYKSDIKLKSVKPRKAWDISRTQQVLGEIQCNILPVIHAISGCDTISQPFGISKIGALKKFCVDEELATLAEAFITPMSKDDIINCGERMLVSLYGGLAVENLDLLRFRKLSTKVMCSSNHVQVQTLPPTSAAARYHSLRAYFQVQEWTNIHNYLVPTEYGWNLTDNRLIPIRTHLQAAPDKLLNMVHCKCKSNCDTKRCTCKKHGLDCYLGCTECRGSSCTNSSSIIDNDSDTESDSD